MNREFTERDYAEMLRCIDPNGLSYDDWLRIGQALHYEGMPCSLWEDWSRRDADRFHLEGRDSCLEKWRTFGRGKEKPVTGGTIAYIAKQHGYALPERVEGMKTYDWDAIIPVRDEPPDGGWITTVEAQPEAELDPVPECPAEWHPGQEAADYLEALFQPEDFVAYTVSTYCDQKSGKWKPVGGVYSRKSAELVAMLRKHPDEIADTFGTYNPQAGAWVCINPVDGQGRGIDKAGRDHMAAFRYALVEGDELSLEEQWRLIRVLRLPVAVVVHSGGKSLHAVVHIDASSREEYSQRVRLLFDFCEKHGMKMDTGNKDPSRLSRLPGAQRGEGRQYIIAGAMGAKDWKDWQRTVLSPFPVDIIDGRWAELPPVKPELIAGVLRVGHKMMIAGASKAGKSTTLIQLAICIAEGVPWMGFQCRRGRVLYCNLEIDRASFLHRVERGYQALNLTPGGLLETVTLRGRDMTMDEITKFASSSRDYAAIIIDPYYKVGVEDENAAGEVGKFCRELDALAERSGASVIYAHHHSKGAQSQKAAMDRASGSGVFARDADALIDLLPLAIPDGFVTAIKAKYGDRVTACRAEFTLREFATPDPINAYFSYPLLIRDEDGLLDEAQAADVVRAQAAGRAKGAITNMEKKAERVADFRDLVQADRARGRVKTLAEYAQATGKTVRTLQRYIQDDAMIRLAFYGEDQLEASTG